MSTLQEIISRVDEIKFNAYSEAAKTLWINKVEGHVKDKVIQTFNCFEITRKKDQSAYDLPAGVSFMNIVMAYMDRKPINKLDVRSLNTIGYFMDSSGKINIYPVPTRDDKEDSPGLRFVYRISHIPYKWPEDKDTDLLLPPPYDEVYEYYIHAMIDWHNREFNAYNNSMVMYNNAWTNMERWYKQNNPLSNNSVKNIW